MPASILGQIENMLNRIKALWPQFDLDGVKNVWIVKPGAKSRGRGKTTLNSSAYSIVVVVVVVGFYASPPHFRGRGI